MGWAKEEGGVTNGEGGPKAGFWHMAPRLEEVIPPLAPAYVGHVGYPMSVIQPQYAHSPQQQQHQHACQPAAGFPPTGTVGEGTGAEGGRVAGVPRLSSSFPVPSPALDEGIVQEVFAEGGREGGREGRLKDAVERGAEAEAGETFMENDKEVMDLFKDGDIESW